MKHVLQEKVIDRIHQFEWAASAKQIIKALFRMVYNRQDDLILEKPKLLDIDIDRIEPLTPEFFEQNKDAWDLPDTHIRKILNHLKSGCRGFMARSGKYLMGYGFVQYDGTYQFGANGAFRIPSSAALLKNLYVFREYRGKSVAKQINAARIASLPEGVLPIVFIIPDNRYAIRNMKMFGFQESTMVFQSTWFSRFTRQKTKFINNTPIEKRLAAGFVN